MKNFTIAFCILISLSFGFPAISSIAQPKSFSEGIYKMQDLNLSPDTNHTLQNISHSEYAFVIIFDANEIVQQLIQLPPLSQEFDLTPILPGHTMLIVGKGEVFIS